MATRVIGVDDYRFDTLVEKINRVIGDVRDAGGKVESVQTSVSFDHGGYTENFSYPPHHFAVIVVEDAATKGAAARGF